MELRRGEIILVQRSYNEETCFTATKITEEISKEILKIVSKIGYGTNESTYVKLIDTVANEEIDCLELEYNDYPYAIKANCYCLTFWSGETHQPSLCQIKDTNLQDYAKQFYNQLIQWYEDCIKYKPEATLTLKGMTEFREYTKLTQSDITNEKKLRHFIILLNYTLKNKTKVIY